MGESGGQGFLRLIPKPKSASCRKQRLFPNIVLENDGFYLYSQKVGDPKSNNYTGLAARDMRSKASITARAPNTLNPSKPGAVSGEEDRSISHMDQAQWSSEPEGFRHLEAFHEVLFKRLLRLQKGYSWE